MNPDFFIISNKQNIYTMPYYSGKKQNKKSGRWNFKIYCYSRNRLNRNNERIPRDLPQGASIPEKTINWFIY